jgi:hypothetical protein
LTRRMIEHLGDLLRLSLDTKDKQEVPLVEELAFLDHYLAIQKIRFGAQLKIEMQIAPDPNGQNRFAVRNREEGGTEVEISLPLRVTGEEANGHTVA